MSVEIKVPDIGDFDKVPVIEVLVGPGDEIEAEQSLITLESDKATMEVPAPQAGTIDEVKVKVDDEVSEGDVIATLTPAEAGAEAGAEEQQQPAQEPEPESQNGAQQDEQTTAEQAPATTDTGDYDCDLLVLGAGPGGYTAAFRAADLGLDVVLVERYPALGGVCLNVGCIPSKALLHVGRVMDEAKFLGDHGVDFGQPKLDNGKLRDLKNGVVKQLTDGLAGLAKKRKVRVVTGSGQFTGEHAVSIEREGGSETITFKNAIIAAGSQAAHLPMLPDDERIMDSTDALELDEIPKRMLLIGGGIIGLEMACVYGALGAEITVVEMMEQLMPGADRDLVKPLQKRLTDHGHTIHLKAKVDKAEALKKGIKVTWEQNGETTTDTFDRVLVAVGRTPNGNQIAADKAGVEVSENGFIAADNRLRTNQPHIHAIGDIVGQPMLAHKATHEGKVAAEVAAGEQSAFDARVIPSVAYTDPEVAWVGVTEQQVKAKGLKVEVTRFPWAASGRALGMGRGEGVTKLLWDTDTGRLVGAGIVGPNAGDLISECALAIEMGADAHDIGLTIHPHPTLSETVAFAAEAYAGTLTDLYMPKR